VLLLTESGTPFKRYVEGSYFGDNEVLLKTERESCAVSEVECDLYLIKKEDFLYVLEKHPEEHKQILDVAQVRDDLHKQAITDAEETQQ